MNVLITDTGEFAQINHIDPVTKQDTAQEVLESAGCFVPHFAYDAARKVWLCSNAVFEASRDVLKEFENP